MDNNGTKNLFGEPVKPAVLVSLCWTGANCRFNAIPDGKPALLKRLRLKYRLVFVCPELLGGLPVPRPGAPLHRKKGQVITDFEGKNVSAQFIAGAEKTLEAAKRNNCKRAYLQKSSPSCDRKGFAGELLIKNKIHVINY